MTNKQTATLSRQNLLAQACTPLTAGQGYSAEQLDAQLAELAEWSLDAGCISRRFGFANYQGTMAFVNAVAGLADREDHHPEMLVGYNRCTVSWSTHSVGGVSINDFICAAKTDAIYAGDPS